MEALLNFFETMPAWQKLLWVFCCLSCSWIFEALSPLFRFDYQKLRHIGVNLVFTACDLLINVVFSLVTVGVFVWAANAEFGLLYQIDLPLWLELLIAIMILDLVAQYFVHYLLHRVVWMWRCHMVHHSDTHVDATTGTRHHPFDYMAREVFALLAIILSGIPLAFYLLYRFITIFSTYFTHANIRLPAKLDRALSYVLITPAMHKFHHHYQQPWTDSNFGNIFSFWDRLFGTLVYDDPKKVVYGLDVADSSKDENLAYQFALPFNRQVKTGAEAKLALYGKSSAG